MKRFFLNTLFGIYVVVAVFVTICLLEYNNYNVTEFGDYSLVIIPSGEVGAGFKKGDLVIVNKKAEVNVGQKVFFYNTYDSKSSSSRNKITLDQIKEILDKKGKTDIFEKKYHRFNAGKTDATDHKEMLFITKVSK